MKKKNKKNNGAVLPDLLLNKTFSKLEDAGRQTEQPADLPPQPSC